MSSCTCYRKELDRGEHYITCPKVMTTKVLELLGYTKQPIPHDQRKQQHMNAEIKANNLIITIPLSKPTPSKSGKTLVVATSGGNKATDAAVSIDGVDHNIIVGLNAYIKP